MLIVHNFQSFPSEWVAANGESGRAIYAANRDAFLAHRQNHDAVFAVNVQPDLVMALAAGMLWGPRRPLISVDIVLREPTSLGGRLGLPLKRALLRRVDHFIHYFQDLRGMQRVYGIGPTRSSYIPFKVNLISRHALEPEPDGGYVLCFGRSMRDFDTFLDAMEKLPFPGAITRPDHKALVTHQGRFTRSLQEIPANIRLLDDDRTEQAEIRILRGARIVVLPILRKSIVASGISTCLNAMYLGKCVIGSSGPGMSDIFTSELLTFPPENAEALAATIRRAWEDADLRRKTAEAGRRFALAVGAEPELYQRIVDQIAVWRRSQESRRFGAPG